MWFSRHVMRRNYGVHGLFRSSGVAGVTLRLGVQTDDMRCVVDPVIVVGAGFARQNMVKPQITQIYTD